MRRCLHPELVKRTIVRDPASGDWRLGRPADAELMVRWTREGEGRTAIPRERAFEIVVEDVFRHIASVKVLSYPYMDYLHVAKLGDRWFIVTSCGSSARGKNRPDRTRLDRWVLPFGTAK